MVTLKIVFFPFLSTSHIIPMIDIARLFSIYGAEVTIITTAGNTWIFQKTIDRDVSHGRSIKTHIIEFPATKVGLPVGIENFNADTPFDMGAKLYRGFLMLQPQIEKYLFGDELEVDCLVSDLFCPWTVEVANKLGIPRIDFGTSSIFARCLELILMEQPTIYTEVKSDHDIFSIEGLPHKLEMTRLQLQDWIKDPNLFYGNMMKVINDSTSRSYGSIFNSFYGLEGAYEEHYKNAFETKCWSLGPVSLWANQDISFKTERGHTKVVEERDNDLFEWLNSKKDKSVIYVSFGSMNKFPTSQLIEIAHALEASSHNFIWVVRKTNDQEVEGHAFLEEFEKRVKERKKGYMIWGWAPQLLILEHKAIGGVVTHCGWNTLLESINVGLPMVTWPLFAEQFLHEKLVVDVLKIGVSVGDREWKDWNHFGSEVVKREDIRKAIGFVMENGKEVEGMRLRCKALSEDSKKAIVVGGSSHANLMQLIEELKSLKVQRLNGGISKK